MRLTILGSTGSVGGSTLDVVRRHPEKFEVFALTANTNAAQMLEQCRIHRPRYAVMSDSPSADELVKALAACGSSTEVLAGPDGLMAVAAAPECDAVMAAIVGAAGLKPTLAAATAGKRLLLANKEALVMSGSLFMTAVRENGALLLPIDSEHNAIFQCMPSADGGCAGGRDLDQIGVRRILLTGSGGPFRTTAMEQLEKVTPEEACAHPNWDMGRKISVDSATMMNKGLEVIEACLLFGTTVNRIEVVIHPQSVVHSMVEYLDGSVLAQLGNPDMRTPIAHALNWPERIESGVASLDLVGGGGLDFEDVDLARFPCLGLATEAARNGGAAGTVLNASNEIAVKAFLERRLRFTDIAKVVSETLTSYSPSRPQSLEDVLAIDHEARHFGHQHVAKRAVQAA